MQILKDKYQVTYTKIGDLQYEEILLISQSPFHLRFVKQQPSEVVENNVNMISKRWVKMKRVARQRGKGHKTLIAVINHTTI